jgi:hypothetical protein
VARDGRAHRMARRDLSGRCVVQDVCVTDSASDRDVPPPRRVLIPLDADEALLALSRFAYSEERSREREVITSSAARPERRGSRETWSPSSSY